MHSTGGSAPLRRPRRSASPDINVTPLVDVVLVLLIIFMVVTPQMESGEPIELPSISFPDDEGKSKLDPVELTVTASGRYLLEKVELPRAGLEDKLKELHAADPTRRLILQGDVRLEYAQAREVYELAQKAGFSGVALKVGKREGDPRQEMDGGAVPAPVQE